MKRLIAFLAILAFTLPVFAAEESPGPSFGELISMGHYPNKTKLTKFGRNAAVGASEEPIWTQSNAYTYITTADTLYISSSNAGDNQDYEIQGLDANWKDQTVTVTAAGQTFTAISGSWMRVFRAKNMGTTNNAGVIYVHIDSVDGDANGVPDTVASDTKAIIDIGANQTLMAIWTVPLGYTFYLKYFYASTSVATKATVVYLRTREPGGVLQVKKVLDINGTNADRRYPFPLDFPEKTDIQVSGLAAGGGRDQRRL